MTLFHFIKFNKLNKKIKIFILSLYMNYYFKKMSKFIGFGNCSKYYLYILYTIIIKAIKNILFGFKDIDQRNKKEFKIINPTPLFNKHTLLQNLFRYLGFSLGGLIFLKIIKKKNTSKKNPIEINEKDNLGIELIHTETELKQNQTLNLIIISIIYCIQNELKKLLYLMNFYYLDFWPINILFLILFMKLYFRMDLYNFQKCSLYFIIITNTIMLLINTFIPQQRDPRKRNEYEIYRDTMGNAALCIPFLLLYLIMYSSISYARVKIKVITTFQFISNYEIIIIMGICGIILTIIEIIFSETIKCNLNEMKEAFQPLCRINTTTNDFYYDELNEFFVDFRNLSPVHIFINVLLMVLYPIINFFEILCELLIIYHLNPIYILVRDNIYYFILRIIVIFLRLNTDILSYLTPRFFILEFAELSALICECIYLQLIELKFCNLNVNLNKNIIDRSNEESMSIFNKDDNTDGNTEGNISKSSENPSEYS